MEGRFGRWLIVERKKARLTQEQLAEAADISRQYISNMERTAPHPITGAAPQPSVEIVDRIADALGVPRDKARLEAGYAPETLPLAATDDEIDRLATYYRHLPRECQLDVLALTRALWERRRVQARAERIHGIGGGVNEEEVITTGNDEQEGDVRKAG